MRAGSPRARDGVPRCSPAAAATQPTRGCSSCSCPVRRSMRPPRAPLCGSPRSDVSCVSRSDEPIGSAGSRRSSSTSGGRRRSPWTAYGASRRQLCRLTGRPAGGARGAARPADRAGRRSANRHDTRAAAPVERQTLGGRGWRLRADGCHQHPLVCATVRIVGAFTGRFAYGPAENSRAGDPGEPVAGGSDSHHTERVTIPRRHPQQHACRCRCGEHHTGDAPPRRVDEAFTSATRCGAATHRTSR